MSKGFDLFALLTGGSSDPPPPPKPVRVVPVAPVISKEEKALSDARKKLADYEKQEKSKRSLAAAARAEAKRLGKTDRPSALSKIDEQNVLTLEADSIVGKSKDLKQQISILQNARGMVQHAQVTRDMHAAVSDLKTQLNPSDIERVREDFGETAEELNELESAFSDTPIGVSVDDLRITPLERNAALGSQLDDLLGDDAMNELGTVASVSTLPALPIPVSPQIISSSGNERRVAIQNTSVPNPITVQRAELARRLNQARSKPNKD